MASTWRRAMHYLGLGPDDEYDEGGAYGDYSQGAQGEEPPRPYGSQRETPGPVTARPTPPGRPSAAPSAPAPPVAPVVDEPDPSAVRPMPAPVPSRDVGVRSTGSVRPVAVAAHLHQVAPVRFNDVQEVGDRFKAGQPVAMDLGGLDRDLARRLIDFTSGLCYALGGSMERLAGDTYLVIPTGAQVSADDRQRLAAMSSEG